jgi:hypothetical protein
VPPHHGVGLHNDQGGTPVPPYLGEQNPKESVTLAEFWTLGRAPQGGQLVTEREIFERNCPMSATDETKRSEEYDQRGQHG